VKRHGGHHLIGELVTNAHKKMLTLIGAPVRQLASLAGPRMTG
jgi:hypothetical protein